MSDAMIRLRLDAECAFHCDLNYVSTQILGAYIISELRCNPGIWLIHKIRVNCYQFIRCNSNHYIIDTTDRLKK